jgi:DHA1 family multidrug resistance protein-like MFS transporter
VQRKPLLVLIGCLLIATIGFGVTLPVLPFYTERFALRRPGSGWMGSVAVQVALLTAVYPLLQLLVAPLWGRLSDRVGRRRVLLIGIAGAAVSYLLFGFATSLTMLYVARAIGGLLSSAIFPAAASYVADSTTDVQRSRGMAWLGTASSLGAVIGPALGGVLARTGWELRSPGGAALISSFAIPFLAAALLALVALVAVLLWLPDSHRAVVAARVVDARGAARPASEVAKFDAATLRGLLALSLAGQFGLALFEATFALFSMGMWGYGPEQVGRAFMVCGVVMTVAQLGIATTWARRVGERLQIAAGLALLGASLGALGLARGTAVVIPAIALLAVGVALIGPNVAALISMRAGTTKGAALGAQSTANGIGQTAGTILGGLLFAWRMHVPFMLAAALLLPISAAVLWRDRHVNDALRTSGQLTD